MIVVPYLNTIHTWISVAAILAGFISFVWHWEISPRFAWGRLYILATFVSCVTSFGIYEHGGFGIPHVLAIVTLLVLRIATAASDRRFGAASPYVETVAFSGTFFFTTIPAIIETATRLPVGAPLVADRQSPELVKAIAVSFGLFVIGTTLQVIRLYRSAKPATDPPSPVAESPQAPDLTGCVPAGTPSE